MAKQNQVNSGPRPAGVYTPGAKRNLPSKKKFQTRYEEGGNDKAKAALYAMLYIGVAFSLLFFFFETWQKLDSDDSAGILAIPLFLADCVAVWGAFSRNSYLTKAFLFAGVIVLGIDLGFLAFRFPTSDGAAKGLPHLINVIRAISPYWTIGIFLVAIGYNSRFLHFLTLLPFSVALFTSLAVEPWAWATLACCALGEFWAKVRQRENEFEVWQNRENSQVKKYSCVAGLYVFLCGATILAMTAKASQAQSLWDSRAEIGVALTVFSLIVFWCADCCNNYFFRGLGIFTGTLALGALSFPIIWEARLGENAIVAAVICFFIFVVHCANLVISGGHKNENVGRLFFGFLVAIAGTILQIIYVARKTSPVYGIVAAFVVVAVVSGMLILHSALKNIRRGYYKNNPEKRPDEFCSFSLVEEVEDLFIRNFQRRRLALLSFFLILRYGAFLLYLDWDTSFNF